MSFRFPPISGVAGVLNYKVSTPSSNLILQEPLLHKQIDLNILRMSSRKIHTSINYLIILIVVFIDRESYLKKYVFKDCTLILCYTMYYLYSQHSTFSYHSDRNRNLIYN